MTKIKLCGIRTIEDVTYVNEVKPDYIGFVFFPQSRRYVTDEIAEELSLEILPGIVKTGVFVNDKIEHIVSLVEKKVIDAVQLHGEEDDEYIRQIRKFVNCPIVRALKVRSQEDIQKAKNTDADLVLLDGGAGQGTVFDWSLIQEMERPYFVAGGLTSENVAKLIAKHRPFGVDVSSAIETNGKKDVEKMRTFVNAVRENIEPLR